MTSKSTHSFTEFSKILVLEYLHEETHRSAVVTREWACSPTGIRKLAGLALGLELRLARSLMDWISPVVWSEIERVIREDWEKAPTAAAELEGIAREFCQAIVLRRLTWEDDPIEALDPFACLRTLSAEQLGSVLRKVEPEEWALLQSFWSAAECLAFYDRIPPEIRRTVALAGERAKKIPQDVLRKSALSLARRITVLLAPTAEGRPSAPTEASTKTLPAEPSVKILPPEATMKVLPPEPSMKVLLAEASVKILPAESDGAVSEALESFVASSTLASVEEKEREIDRRFSEFYRTKCPSIGALVKGILEDEELSPRPSGEGFGIAHETDGE